MFNFKKDSAYLLDIQTDGFVSPHIQVILSQFSLEVIYGR